MIKAVQFSYLGGPRQGTEIIIDDEKNIEARIQTLCHRGVRHYEHSEPKEVPLEKVNVQQLTARDLMNLVKLGVQEQYEDQFSRFMGKFDKDCVKQEFQVEHDDCMLTATPIEVEERLASLAQAYDDYTSGRISITQAVDVLNSIKFIRFLKDEPVSIMNNALEELNSINTTINEVDEFLENVKGSKRVIPNDLGFPVLEAGPGWTVLDEGKVHYIGDIISIDTEKLMVTYKLSSDGTEKVEPVEALKDRVVPF